MSLSIGLLEETGYGRSKHLMLHTYDCQQMDWLYDRPYLHLFWYTVLMCRALGRVPMLWGFAVQFVCRRVCTPWGSMLNHNSVHKLLYHA